MSLIELVELSYPGILLVFGLVVTLLSMGSEVWKIKPPPQKNQRSFLFVLGVPSILYSLFFICLHIYEEVLDTEIKVNEVKEFFWGIISAIYSFRIYLGIILGVFVISFLIFYYRKNSGYAIDAVPVIENNDAKLRLTNIGRNDFVCSVYLLNIVMKDPNGRATEETIINLDEANPSGKPFDEVELQKDEPVRVCIVDEIGHSQAILCVGQGKSLKLGRIYKLEIGLFRKKKSKKIQMETLEKELIVAGGYQLEWYDEELILS